MILIVGNFLSASGITRGVCEDLAEHLIAQGVEVITTSSQPNRLRRPLDMLMTTWTNRHRYTVAHVEVYSGLAFRWAELVCWLLRLIGKPYILTLHGGNLPEFGQQNPARVRHLFAPAALVTTPSRYLLEQMQPYSTKLRLIPNPIDLQNCAYQPRASVRPRLMWLRAFDRIYNAPLALRVLDQLRRDFPNVRLTMVGQDKDGTLRQVEALARDLGVSDRLEIPGQVPKADVPIWLQKGDIFLNTTDADNTPISVIEAMACGLCVISTNVGGLSYLLTNERDALLVPPNDADAMADAVRRILADPALAARLSQNAYDTVKKWDWTEILPEWISIYEQVSAQPISRRIDTMG